MVQEHTVKIVMRRRRLRRERVKCKGRPTLLVFVASGQWFGMNCIIFLLGSLIRRGCSYLLHTTGSDVSDLALA